MKKVLFSFLAIVLLLSTACSQAAPTPTAAPAAAKPAAAPTAAPAAPAAATQPAAAAPTAAAAQPAKAPVPTGELKIALSSLGMETFDPSKVSPTGRFWHRLVFDNAVGADAVGNKIAANDGLASSWQLSPDAMKLTVNLRKGIKYHNGEEMTADDLKFALERVISPKGTSSYSGLFRESIKDMQVSDPYTLVINAKQATPLMPIMLSQLSGPEGEVYPKKYVESKGEDVFLKAPVGSGPYKFVEHASGNRMVFEAFDGYWRGAPKYKKITLLMVPEEATRLVMLKRGEVDIVDVSRENLADMKKAGFSSFAKDASAVLKISLEIDKRAEAANSPLTKLPVRRALSLAINRKELVDSLFYGQAAAAGSQFGTYAQEYEPLAPDPFDPAKAKQLLKDAGYPNGFTLDYYSVPVAGFSEITKVNEAVAGYWKAIGVDVKLKQTELDSFIDLLRKGDLQKVGTVNGYSQPNQFLTLSIYQGSLSSKGRNAYVGSGDNYLFPELEALVNKAAATVDDAQRLAVQKQMQKYVYDNLLVLPLVEVGSLFVAKSDIKKWELGKLGYDYNFADLFKTW